MQHSAPNRRIVPPFIWNNWLQLVMILPTHLSQASHYWSLALKISDRFINLYLHYAKRAIFIGNSNSN